ncbi:hypothetical protein GCM10023193_04710 [Planotetraspora kaengkrachanensis]
MADGADVTSGIETPAVAALATPTNAIENSALATRPRDFNDPPRSGYGIPQPAAASRPSARDSTTMQGYFPF